MVYVLILLLLISMMGTSLVRGAIAQHRQRRHDEVRAQTVRLAEAGWNRARWKLTQSADYAGEMWQLGDDALGPECRANVRIEIASDNDRRTLRVNAEYPVESPMVTRFTLEGPLPNVGHVSNVPEN